MDSVDPLDGADNGHDISGFPSGTPIAFFDLDRTLLDCNSGLLYVLAERRAGRLGLPMLMASVAWFGLHHLSLLDVEKAYLRAARQWRGRSAAELRLQVDAWFGAEVAHRMRPGAAPVLQAHRRRGEPCVLLTNSSSYVAEVACRTFGLDGYIANPLLEDGHGRLSGLMERPLCYGAGKTTRALRWATERGLTLENAHFYTDSYSDLHTLESVPHPVVVHPDPKLRRIASLSGWPIQLW